jgi:hypothetical protein
MSAPATTTRQSIDAFWTKLLTLVKKRGRGRTRSAGVCRARTRRLAIGNGGFAGGDGYLSTSSMLSSVRTLTDQRSRVSGFARSIR